MLWHRGGWWVSLAGYSAAISVIPHIDWISDGVDSFAVPHVRSKSMGARLVESIETH